MFDPSNAPIELAMTHRVSPNGDSVSCPRPDPVRAMVPRMYAWRSAPESCQICLATNAVRVRSGIPFCQRCLDIRTANSADVATLRRHIAAEPTERAANERGLSGYSIVFNAKSVDLGGFREVIMPEAVTRTISQGTDLLALWNHKSDLPIGRISAGTLRVQADRRGLWADITPPTSAVREMEAVQRGDVKGQSFAFRAIEDDWVMDGDMPLRFVLDMSMSEISIVIFPAYKATTIGVGQNPQRSIEWYQRKLKQASA
jgi:HK97 family phage prohead protease